VLSFYFSPDLSAGSFRITALVRALEQQLAPDDSIEVVTTLPNRYHSFTQEAPEHERHGRVCIKRIALPSHRSGMLDQVRAFGRYAIEVLRYLKGRRFDLVYATSSRLFTAALGAMCARKMNVPLYLDIRDILTDTIQDVLPGYTARLLLPLLRAIERYAVRSASRVNLVSEGFREYFDSRYRGQTYSFYTNGIDEEFVNANFRRAAHTNGRRIILYAGNFGDGQGLHRIVPGMAAALKGKYEFWLVGDGGKRQALLDAIHSAGADNVKVMPPVDRTRLLELYRDCDYIFLHLNDYDAFRKVLPSKLFEYAATGKPILAGVAGYAATFLADNVEGSAVFHPCDVKAGVLALQTLSPELTSRSDFIRRFGREQIMKELARDVLSLAQ
jgi:glycosyltransferase involved in cell wall biosynthesis